MNNSRARSPAANDKSGAAGGLDFYWAVNGTATWNFEQVEAPGALG